MPISSFIHFSEATWTRMLRLENGCEKTSVNSQFRLLPCEGRFYSQSIRKILGSEDVGIILLGSLKVSSLSSPEFI